MNIKSSYLYRDGANYKQFNQVVFDNLCNLTVEEIGAIIKKQLIDGQWFVAKEWDLPDLHFKEYTLDFEIDHDWHKFEGIEETIEEVTNNKRVDNFLLLVNKTKLPFVCIRVRK